MRVTSKRLRLILIGLLVLVGVIFLLTAVVGLNKLSGQSQQLVDTKVEAIKLDAQLASLEKARKQVEQYAYFNDVAKTVIPSDKDQAQAVLDIIQIARQANLAISGITFPASTLGASGSVSATSAGASVAAISQAKPVTGIKGLYSLELTIDHQTAQVPGDKLATYPKLIDFLSRLERNRRTAQITKVMINPPTPNSPVFNFTLVVNVFMRPQK